MTQLSPQTLITVIQSLEAERERLAIERDAAEGSQAADIDEILLSCDKAAEELKQAFLDAFETYDNLPAYADLVALR
jgi:hypothetical protein